MDNIKMATKVPFKVSARTAKLIGLENFSNEEGAIIAVFFKRYFLVFYFLQNYYIQNIKTIFRLNIENKTIFAYR